jgi:hypothetical protein
VDDIPKAIDPATNQQITTADDPDTTGDKVITVWDITAPNAGTKHRFEVAVCKIPISANIAVTWTATPISGSTFVCHPANPTAVGEARYFGLPTANSEFGNKMIQAHKGGGVRSRQVQIFYGKDEISHPLDPGTEQWPNWFYYWRQTPASLGMPIYNPSEQRTGRAIFQNGQWVSTIGPAAALGPAGQNGTLWGSAEGIDLFAHVCRHEYQHVLDLTADWGNADRVPAEDADGDWLKDTLEHLKTSAHPSGYDPMKFATYSDHFNYGANWSDIEDYALHRQPGWTNGSANHLDWSAGVKSKQW